jgi:hypothetical protein
MLGSEIEEYFRGKLLLKHHFRGIFSSDQVPLLRQKTFAIINTDNALGDGKHWYVLLNFAGFECFDSLGISADQVKARLPQLKACIFNRTQLQSEKSSSCGWFAIYFASCRALNADLTFEEVCIVQIKVLSLFEFMNNFAGHK